MLNDSGDLVLRLSLSGNTSGIFLVNLGSRAAQAARALAQETPPIEFTGVAYDPDSSTATLEWNSRPGATYAVEASSDLLDWDEIAGSLASGGIVTRFSDVSSKLRNSRKRFYRIREVDLKRADIEAKLGKSIRADFDTKTGKLMDLHVTDLEVGQNPTKKKQGAEQ